MNIADKILTLYCYNKEPIELDELLDNSLNLYFDDTLQDMYPHKKKSYTLAIFLRDIDSILQKQNNKSHIFCCFPKKNKSLSLLEINLMVHEFIYTYKLPIFIDEILQLYRNKNTLEIDEIKKNQRSYDLFLLLKYIGNHDKCDKIKDMSRDDKLNLIKKIIQDIIII
jgi:hypothetical protein